MGSTISMAVTCSNYGNPSWRCSSLWSTQDFVKSLQAWHFASLEEYEESRGIRCLVDLLLGKLKILMFDWWRSCTILLNFVALCLGGQPQPDCGTVWDIWGIGKKWVIINQKHPPNSAQFRRGHTNSGGGVVFIIKDSGRVWRWITGNLSRAV